MFNKIIDFFNKNSDENQVIFYNHEKPVSVAQYKKDVAKYANYFSKLPDSSITVYIPDNLYLFYVCFMALLQADKDIVLPALLTVENSKTLVQFAPGLLTDKFNSFGEFNIIDLNCPDNTNWEFKNVDDRFIYFFTSGSTGTPKRIKKQFKMLSAEVAWHCVNQKHLIDKNPVMISSVAPYHMYGLLWRFLFPLYAGIQTDLDIVFTPEELQHKQSIYKNILFATTPSFLDGLTRFRYLHDDQAGFIVIAGHFLQLYRQADAFHAFFLQLFIDAKQVYGPVLGIERGKVERSGYGVLQLSQKKNRMVVGRRQLHAVQNRPFREAEPLVQKLRNTGELPQLPIVAAFRADG